MAKREWKLSVGIDTVLEKDSLAKTEKKLEQLEKPIEVKVDTKSAEKKIDGLNSRLEDFEKEQKRLEKEFSKAMDSGDAKAIKETVKAQEEVEDQLKRIRKEREGINSELRAYQKEMKEARGASRKLSEEEKKVLQLMEKSKTSRPRKPKAKASDSGDAVVVKEEAKANEQLAETVENVGKAKRKSKSLNSKASEVDEVKKEIKANEELADAVDAVVTAKRKSKSVKPKTNEADATKQQSKANDNLAKSYEKVGNVIERTAEEQKKLDDLNRSAKNQKHWIRYLDDALDKSKFESSGKRDATAKLKSATNYLVTQRKESYQNAYGEYAKEMAEVIWMHAYQEAERQGVAESVLSKYDTDAKYDYKNNLKTLQKEYDFRQKLLENDQKEIDLIINRTEALKENADVRSKLTALDEKAKATDDSVELFKILKAREEIVNLADAESLLDEKELENQRLINAELQKKLDLSRIATNIVYHAGDLSNLDQTLKSFRLGNVTPHESGNVFNGFTGLYTTEDVDGFWANEWDGAPISSIDLSHYKMFNARNQELAIKARDFFDNLNGTIYGYLQYFDGNTGEMLKDHNVKSVEDLYKDFKEVFNNIDLDFESFANFIKKSQEFIAGHSGFIDIDLPAIDEGVAKAAQGVELQGVAKEVFNSDSFQTQLLKMLGYEGIDLRSSGFHTTYTGGTVVFDVKPESLQSVNGKWTDVMGQHGYTIDEVHLQYEEKRRQLAFDTAEAYSKQNDEQKEIADQAQISLNADEKQQDAADDVIENNKKAITSYEELCEKLQEYIALKEKVVSLHSSGEDISQYVPQLRELEADLTRGISDSLDASSATMMLQSFPVSIDERAMTNNLAHYFGFEIPKAIENTSEAIDVVEDELKNIEAQPENTKWIDELRTRADALGDEFKESQQYKDFFAGIESGSITAANAVQKLDEAFEKFNTNKIVESTENVGEDLNSKILNLISPEQMQKAFDSVELGAFFKSLNIKDEGTLQYLKNLYIQLLLITKAFDDGIVEEDKFNNAFADVVDSIMEFGSVTHDAHNIYEDFYEYMKGKKISYNEGQKAEFGDDWTSNRKRFGKYLTPLSSGKGIGIDQLWEELSRFGLFSEEDGTNEKTQLVAVLRELGKAIDARRNGGKLSYALTDRNIIEESVIGHWGQMMYAATSTIQQESQKQEAALEGVEGQAKETAQGIEDMSERSAQAAQKASEEWDVKSSNGSRSRSRLSEESNRVLDKVRLRFVKDKESGIYLPVRVNTKDYSLLEKDIQRHKRALERTIDKNIGEAGGIDIFNDKFKADYKEYLRLLGEMRKAQQNITSGQGTAEDFNNFDEAADNANKLKTSLEGVFKEQQKAKKFGDEILKGVADSSDVDKLKVSMLALASEVTDSKFELKGFNDAGTEMYGVMRTGAETVEEITVALKAGTNQIVAYRGATKTVVDEWEKLKSNVGKGVAQVVGMYVGFQDIVRYARQGVQSVREIDLAMTELKKVTDETEDTYSKFLDTASKTAGSIGSTVKDFTNVTSDFARLGYNISEASEMAKTALIYENVGDGFSSVEEASQSIISTMKAFGVEAEDTMGIVDRFNEVGNNFAIDSKGIGDALQRSASALVEGGNSIDEAIGLVTAANSVIQNPEQVGTALKTLSLRLRSTKIELEEMGEDAEGAATSTAKLRAQMLGLTGGKVDIMIDDTTFKNTTQILREMAEVWDELDDISKAGALELMGGKRQANILASVITNFETVEEAIATSMDSSGSAFKENQKYLESIQGRIDIFNNALQTFWNNFISSDVIKFAVDSGTTLIELLDTGTGKLLALVAALKVAAKMKGFSFAGIGQSISTQIQEIVKAQNAIKVLRGQGTDPAIDGIEGYAKAVANLTGQQQAAVLASENLSKQQIIEAMRANGVKEEVIRESTAHIFNTKAKQQNAAASMELSEEKAKEMAAILRAEAASATGTAQSAKAAAAAYLEAHAHEQLTKEIIEERIARGLLTQEAGAQILKMMSGTSGLLGGIGIFLKTNWVSILLSLIPVAIGLISKLKGKQEELNKTAEDTFNTYSNAKKELSSIKKTVDDVSAEFEKLSKGVDSSGNNVSLSTKEYERYNEVVNEIADMFPDMVTGYTEEGNAILKCKGNVEELTEAYEAAAQAARQEAIAGAEDVFKAFKGNYDNVAVTRFGESGLKQQLEVASELVDLIGNKDIVGVSSFFDSNVRNQNDINNMLEAAGLSRKDFNGPMEDIQKAMPKLLSFVRSTTTGINSETNKVKSIMDAYLGEDFDYAKLDNETQNIVNTLVSNLSADFISEFDTSDDLYNWIKTNIVGAFTDPELSKTIGGSITEMVDLQEQFERGKIPIGTYKEEFLALVDDINTANIDPKLKDQIKSFFNIDLENPDSIGKDIDAMIAHAESLFGDNLTESIQEKISKLNYSDLISTDGLIVPDRAFKSWDEFIDFIIRNKTISFDIDYDVEAEGLEKLQSAIEETVSGSGMSAEAISNIKSRYQDLENYDAARLFEETANGIHLNVQASRELEDAYEEQNKKALDNKLEALTEEYNNLTLQIQDTSDAFERAKLYSHRNDILKQINDTATLATRYEGLTSAYNKWQKAQSGATERDMYEGIISGKKEVDEEIKRGWIDAGTREYLSLLSGEDLSAAPFEKILEVYKQLGKTIDGTKYDVYDFFTKDADDNATVDGIYNFFDAVMAVQKEGQEWVKKNEDGSFVFDFSVNGGEEAIAEALGISEELVQIILRAAADAGFDINIESAYTDLANLKDEATTANEKLKELGATDYNFNINSTNIENLNEQIEEAKKALDTFKNEDGTVNVQAEGAEEAKTLLATLIYQKQTLDDAAVLKVDTSNADVGIETTVKKLQDFKAAYNELEVKMAIGEDTTEAETKLNNAITQLQMEDPSIRAKLGIDLTKSHEEINTAINNISADALIELGVDKSKIDGYMSEEHSTSGTVVWENNIDAVTSWMKKKHEVTGKVKWENDDSKVKTAFSATKYYGFTRANGTAHVNGNWGAPKTETALVGELGPEMVVRGNRWFTVGDNGVEFTDIKKGDIIFNHKQTEDLLSKGYVTGRGKAYANGTAYASASKSSSIRGVADNIVNKAVGFFDNIFDFIIGGAEKSSEKAVKEAAAKNATETNKNSTIKSQLSTDGIRQEVISQRGSYGSGPSEEDSNELRTESPAVAPEESKQLIDFIEIKLEEIEATISKTSAELTTYLDDASASTIKDKDTAYDKLVNAEKEKASTYFQAAEYYNKKAAALLEKVPAKYREQAKNGAIEIKNFVGESQGKIAEAIQEYRDMAAKADGAETGYLEAIAQQAAYRVEQLEDIASDYENIVNFISSESSLIQSQIDLTEKSGERVSGKYYEELINNSKEQQKQLNQEKKDLQKILDDSVESGDVQVGTDEWYQMVEEITSVDEEITQCSIDVEEFQNAINDLKWEALDKLIAGLDNVDSQLSHLHDRLTDGKVVDDKGNWNEKGIAAMGVLAQQMEVAEAKSKQYADAIDYLNKNWKKDGYSQDEYNEKLAELTENQWDSIEAYEDAKDAIVDLNKARVDAVKDGMDKELDAYKKLIDKKKEALDADKDLHDFEKSVAEQQKEISDIERRLAALSGDTSTSAAAERKQLEAELLEAKAALEETYYDRSIENQKTALDNEYTNYEEHINDEKEKLDKYLEDEEKVISDSMQTVKANADIVLGEINAISQQYGVDISNAITTPWNNGSSAIADYDNKFNESTSKTIDQINLIIKAQQDLENQAKRTAEALLQSISSNQSKVTSASYSGSGSGGSKSNNNTSGGGNKSSTAGTVSGLSGNIGYGSTGSNVTALQQTLKDLGYDTGKVDGIFGAQTQAAVKQYQQDQGIKADGIVGTNTKNEFKKDGYAKGTLGTPKSDWAWIDEIGEELVLHAGSDGKLSYLTKGTSVIPADLTSKLMDLAIDPTQTLEASRPVINAPHITNNEINIDMNFGSVVNIEHVDQSDIPDLTKAVEKQMDKYMKNLNNQIRKYSR